jgi:ribonuclease VapC
MELIVADTSSLVAILQKEAEAEQFLDLIKTCKRVVMSAVSVLEAGIVLQSRRGTAGAAELMDLIDAMGIEVADFDEAAAHSALRAFQRYGKGIHPRARLNFGDCAVYALASDLNVPLLYKGDDFAATDIQSAALRS